MVNKFLYLLVTNLFAIIFFTVISPVKAELVAGNSATMYYTKSIDSAVKNNEEAYFKKKVLKNYLRKFPTDLVNQVDSFINACTQYELDCYLLPAISGVESTFGKFMAPQTNNPFGWGRGLIRFESYDQAIMTVGKGLRENYLNKGATTVEEIGRIYCEGNTWASKVSYFIRQMENEEKNLLLLTTNKVEL